VTESGFNPALADQAREALGEARDAIASYVEEQGTEPAASSSAMAAVEAHSQPDVVRAVWTQSSVLIEVAADQLTAFLKTVTPPVETIAPWTATRSALEAGAIASWLLQTEIDDGERVARGLALRFDGLDLQVKAMRAASSRELDDGIARRQYVVDLAASLGYAAVISGGTRTAGAGMRMPSVTELTSSISEEATYRVLSAVAHGHQWALQQVSFEITDNPSDATGTTRALRKQLRPEAVIYLALIVFKSLSWPVWLRTTYFGWDQGTLRAVLGAAADNLPAPDRYRIWDGASD
jgi:hypothetical protein